MLLHSSHQVVVALVFVPTFHVFSSSFTSHVLAYSYFSPAGTDDRGRSYATSKGGCKICKCDECDVFI